MIDLLSATPLRRALVIGSLPMIWILAMNVAPIVEMVRISFLSSYPPTVGKQAVWTLASWRVFFGDPIYIYQFFRTLTFAMVVTGITLMITYPVAYYVAKVVRPERQLRFMLVLLVPFWVGEIVRTYAIMILLGNRGFINMLLIWLGIIDQPLSLIYSNFSVGFGVIYLTSLYMMMPLYAALERIPTSQLEAAADLGAGPLTRFWKIILPQSRSGISSGCVLVFLISIGIYATPVLLGGSRTTMFAETIAGFFMYAGDTWPIGAAFSGIMLVGAMVVCGIFMRLVGGKEGSILR
ncbi:ABC transporter permease [Aureimonas fodinaquatilis]|uniref:ABC transporter permease n=1 Tax=Aureimonas fodinaquatilis TaxID=2565783 RepID=UPI001FE8C6D9|nr:ABC transporter permease [Aureimonas fodinaquatilis]